MAWGRPPFSQKSDSRVRSLPFRVVLPESKDSSIFRGIGETHGVSPSSPSGWIIKTSVIPLFCFPLVQCPQFFPAEFFRRRREKPLVGVGFKGSIQEETVSLFPCFFLQRKGNKIAEASLWECVLTGKESIIGIEADLMPSPHGSCQNYRSKPSGQ